MTGSTPLDSCITRWQTTVVPVLARNTLWSILSAFSQGKTVSKSCLANVCQVSIQQILWRNILSKLPFLLEIKRQISITVL